MVKEHYMINKINHIVALVPIIFLNNYSFIALHNFIRHTHAQVSTFQMRNSWYSLFLPIQSSQLEQPHPGHHTLYYCLFLQKQSQDIFFLSLLNTSTKQHCPSSQLVCIVSLCMYVCFVNIFIHASSTTFLAPVNVEN